MPCRPPPFEARVFVGRNRGAAEDFGRSSRGEASFAREALSPLELPPLRQPVRGVTPRPPRARQGWPPCRRAAKRTAARRGAAQRRKQRRRAAGSRGSTSAPPAGAAETL